MMHTVFQRSARVQMQIKSRIRGNSTAFSGEQKKKLTERRLDRRRRRRRTAFRAEFEASALLPRLKRG